MCLQADPICSVLHSSGVTFQNGPEAPPAAAPHGSLCQGRCAAHRALRRRMPSCCWFMSPSKAPKISKAFMNCMYKLFYHCISFNPTLPKLSVSSIPSSLFFKSTFCFVCGLACNTHIYSSWTMHSRKGRKKQGNKKGRKQERRKKVTENSKNPESNVSGTAIILYEAAGKIDCQGSKG